MPTGVDLGTTPIAHSHLVENQTNVTAVMNSGCCLPSCMATDVQTHDADTGKSVPRPARSVVAASIQARGGAEKLRLLDSFTIQSIVFDDSRKSFELTEHVKRGRYLAISKSPDGRISKHGFDGDQLWESNTAGTRRIEGKFADALRERLQDKMCLEQAVLGDDFELVLFGEGRMADEDCHVVSFNRRGVQPPSLLYFSKSDGFLIGHDAYAFPDAVEPDSSVVFSDYRAVRGWRIPFRTMTTWHDGRTRLQLIENISFQEITDQEFAFPKDQAVTDDD